MSSTEEKPTVFSTMTDLANAVRTATGKTDKMNCREMVDAIQDKLSGSLRDREKEFIEGTLESVSLPQGATTIVASTFSGCTSLKSVEIPDSVKAIGAEAFSGCTSLTSIEIPSSVTTIEDGAFFGCSIHFSFVGVTEPPSGIPWGATSYTVEYLSSESV